MSAKSKLTTAQTVHAGFMPLVDCAPLVIAKELGFARQEGLKLELHREVSWSNIRDKIIVGHFECAHMLAPMPIASSLGLNHVRQPVITPLTLSLNGNAITVSTALHAHIRDVMSQIEKSDKSTVGLALAKVIAERNGKNSRPLTFGIVFPHSCQNYELRDWLQTAGISPDHDVRLVGLPPSMMVESLRAGQIDGFCAGEPWNSAAVAANAGAIITTKEENWRLAPEKVLGVRLEWAEHATDHLFAVMRALVQSMDWLAIPDNLDQAAAILAGPDYVGVDRQLILKSISNRIVYSPGKTETTSPAFLKFPQGTESSPSRTHMSWLLHMMHKSGQLDDPMQRAYAIDDVARCDLWETVTGLTASNGVATDAAIALSKGIRGRDPADILSELASHA